MATDGFYMKLYIPIYKYILHESWVSHSQVTVEIIVYNIAMICVSMCIM